MEGEREKDGREHSPLNRPWRLIRAHMDKIFIFPYVAESTAATVCAICAKECELYTSNTTDLPNFHAFNRLNT